MIPGFDLLAGSAEHPFAERNNQPQLFSNGNEVLRENLAVLWVVPAHQCFHADDAAAQHIHLRLVTQEKFASLDAPSQARFHFEAFREQEIEITGEKARSIASSVLGLVHRRISVLQELLHIRRIIRVMRDANRGGYR